MNKKRRERLMCVVKKLEECCDIVSSINDEEMYCIENTPENLRESDRYQRMEDISDSLDDAVDQIEYAIENIESACEE